MSTNHGTIEKLVNHIVSHLGDQNTIEYNPARKSKIVEDLSRLVSPYVLTDEDLKQKAVQKVGMGTDALKDSNFTESEQFRTARAMVRKQYGEMEISGLYYQKSLKDIASSIRDYFLDSTLIEEVFAEDRELDMAIVEQLKVYQTK